MWNSSDLSVHEHGLYFDTERNLRYHQRRAAWYQHLHTVNSIFNVIFAGSALLALHGVADVWWVTVMGAVAAVFNVTDIVLHFAEKAALHRGMCRNWSALNQRAKRLAPQDVSGWATLGSDIDSQNVEEPQPVYRVLDLLCDAEASVALGLGKRDYLAKLSRWQIFTANMWPWSNVGMQVSD